MKIPCALWVLMKLSSALWVLLMSVILISTIEACPQYCECNFGWTVKIICKELPSFELLARYNSNETKNFDITGGYFTSLSSTDISNLPKQIEELSITKGQLQQLNGETFKSLTSLKILKLNNNHITTIPGNAFLGSTFLHTLDLSNNNLQSINTETFRPLTHLTYLDLSYCNLNNIPSGLFSSNTNLFELIISHNQIGNLRGTSFQGLINLRRLVVSYCDIRTIENDFFQQMKMLESLDLSNNAMQALPNEGKLALFKNLKYLTLAGNKLTALTDGTLQNVKLTTLDLSNNLITSLGENAFIDAVLHNLNMSGNQIQSLPEGIFQPIASTIVTLKLNSNRNLKKLPSKIFYGMYFLQILDLSACSIQFLSSEHFDHISRLLEIDVSSNDLQSLPETFFDDTMYSVRLDTNPWHCDCHIKPLRDWLKTQRCAKVIPYRCPKLMCASPVHLLHKDIEYLKDTDLEACDRITASRTSSNLTIILGVLAGIVFIVIVMVGVICCLYHWHKDGQPFSCTDPYDDDKKSQEPEEPTKVHVPRGKNYKKTKKKEKYHTEKKVKRTIVDPEIASLNESDKSFVVRNYFHSMDPEVESEGTESMTKKWSEESLSQSGFGYGSQRGSKGSRDSCSQYSHNAGCHFESAV